MMRKFLTVMLIMVFALSMSSLVFGAKKKSVVSLKEIYDLDSLTGMYFELFLKEYNLKMPKKIDLNFAQSRSEFQVLVNLTNINTNLGAVTVNGVIIISSDKITDKNRKDILKELMRITLIENKKKEKDIERIIDEFFKKKGIK